MTAAAFLAAVIAIMPAAGQIPRVAASDLSALQQQQAELKRQQEETAAELAALKEDQARQQEYVNTLQSQMDNLMGQIDNLNAQISDLDAQIVQKEGEIAEKQASIDADFELLKDRLHAMYLAGEASTLQILLGSENVADFMEKTQFMQTITEHDTNLINGLKVEMAEIQDEKDEIEADKKQVAANKEELDAKSQELSALVEENEAALARLTASVTDVNSRNNELAREREAVDDEIDAWYRDYYARNPQQSSSGGSSGSGGSYTGTGNFTWPVPGYTKLTSYWGDGRNHKGIDIAGSGIYGKPIVAADSGKVIKAVHSGWGGGYGLCVYLDHGNGYSTRYGHMSKVLVNTGDTVEKGQVIGYVGNTGDSSGPHLHFEIRIDGVAQNPMNWFS